MSEELAERPQADTNDSPAAATIEAALVSGELAKLAPAERVKFYTSVCRSLGLNPLTKPFQYIVLNGKLQFYATKDCTEQLRNINSISVEILSREVIEEIFIVTARATNLKTMRRDEAVGAVPLGQLKGEARANAMMKAETKAKRRVTLSICGLGMVDQSETESIPGAARVEVDLQTGEIQEGGSREAQQEVAKSKLEDLKASEPEARKAWFATMLDGFSAMKEAIGDESYYAVLGRNGYEHANQIPDRKTAQAIYKEMAAARVREDENG